VSNINDVYSVAARAFPSQPVSTVETVLCDLDGNSVLNINDVYLAAQNSNLTKAHSPCGSDVSPVMPPTPTPTPTIFTPTPTNTFTPTPTATFTPTPTPTDTPTPTPTATFTLTPTPTHTPTPTPTPTPCPGDRDCDEVPDALDNCPGDYNPAQTNTDGQRRPNGSISGEWASNPAQDAAGDACDPDDDNDGLLDSKEFDDHCPYRLVADSDGDRVLDGYEVANGYDPCDPTSRPTWQGGGDSDGDGFPDKVERMNYNTCVFAGDSFPGYTACINPADSDGDGCADWIEIVDLDGNRVSNINDVYSVAARAFPPQPVSTVETVLCDLDGNGVLNINDVYLAAQNSNLTKAHSPCGPEG
jgi:hypothetical protein